MLRIFKCAFVAAICSTLMVCQASAAMKTFSNGVGTFQWGPDGNWTPSGRPSVVNGADTVDIPVSFHVNNGTGVIYTAGGSGNPTDFRNNSTVNIYGSLIQAGGTNTGAAGYDPGNAGTFNIIGPSGLFNTGTMGTFYIGQNGGTGTVNVDGGTWAIGNTTFRFSQGELNIKNGGQVSMSGTFVFTEGASSRAIKIESGGSLNLGDRALDIRDGASFHMSGASSEFITTNQLNPRTPGAVTILGGTFTASRLNFNLSSVDSIIEFGAGRINLTGQGSNSFGNISATRYLNFTGWNTVLFLGGATETNALTLLNNDSIRYLGDTDNSLFYITTVQGGVEIRPTAIPEPASLSMVGLGLVFGLRRARRSRRA